MNTELTEYDEGFEGVCKLCGTDCGAVRQLFDEKLQMQKEKDDLRTAFEAFVKHLEGLKISGLPLLSFIPAQSAVARAAIEKASR
jgi:hypothetical protein